MPEPQHTPTPWREGNSTEILVDYPGRPGKSLAVATVHTGLTHVLGNRAFIVRACNSHEALVAACRALAADMKELADSGDTGFWKAEEQDVYKQAMAALAAAESTP